MNLPPYYCGCGGRRIDHPNITLVLVNLFLLIDCYIPCSVCCIGTYFFVYFEIQKIISKSFIIYYTVYLLFESSIIC